MITSSCKNYVRILLITIVIYCRKSASFCVYEGDEVVRFLFMLLHFLDLKRNFLFVEISETVSPTFRHEESPPFVEMSLSTFVDD